MGKKFEQLTEQHIEFIKEQKIFFVATAAPEGKVNLSPKGLNSLQIIDQNRVLWLNLTGSGNETAAHLKLNPRMTIMLCSFDETPLILRMYGRARAIHLFDPEWSKLIPYFGEQPGQRQIIDMQIDLVQTSCGFGVPNFEYRSDKNILVDWATKKGSEGITEYWREKNLASLDGYPTGIFN